VSAVVAREATAQDHIVLADYVTHCRELGVSDRAVCDRLRAARTFLGAHPDLQEWMGRPVHHRLVELRRTRAWPLLVFVIGTGRLRLDLELAGTKHLAGLGRLVEHQHAASFAAARAAGLRLGWTQDWVETVLHECLAVLLAWHGGAVSQLNAEVMEAFDVALGQTPTIPASSRLAYRCRLASLRQVLFEVSAGVARDGEGGVREPWPDEAEQGVLAHGRRYCPRPTRLSRCCRTPRRRRAPGNAGRVRAAGCLRAANRRGFLGQTGGWERRLPWDRVGIIVSFG